MEETSASGARQLEVIRKGPSSPSERRSERHEASEEPRNVRLYMSSDERRFVARSSFSDGLQLATLAGNAGLFSCACFTAPAAMLAARGEFDFAIIVEGTVAVTPACRALEDARASFAHGGSIVLALGAFVAARSAVLDVGLHTYLAAIGNRLVAILVGLDADSDGALPV